MTYKTILIQLDNSPSLDSRSKLAANLAKRENAHLVGIAPIGVAVIPGDSYLSVTGDLLAQVQTELDEAAYDATQRFERICLDMDVDSFESSAEKIPPSDAILTHGQHSDLIIVGQAGGKDQTAMGAGFVEQVILGAGKPVLVVPHTGHCTDAGKRILVAWDGSKEVARATTDAMPILKAADAVEIILVSAKASQKGESIPGSDVARYLARQNVNVEVKEIVSDIDVGETVLSHATDFGADLLVMGAYGHSRVREWVMGGVTRTLLNSMTVPVLMSH